MRGRTDGTTACGACFLKFTRFNNEELYEAYGRQSTIIILEQKYNVNRFAHPVDINTKSIKIIPGSVDDRLGYSTTL